MLTLERDNEQSVYFDFQNVTGFKQTSTYTNFGDPSQWGKEWHTMPISDCEN